MVRDSGFPRADAESDFLRARRHQTLSALAARLRSGSKDTVQAMSFDEVVEALGRKGQGSLGLQVIPLDLIVGSVDKVREFDRRFRPTSGRNRQRWERISLVNRTGNPLPPIDVYKLGDMYFVQDGHHRVSVSRAVGLKEIDANVTEIQTMLTPVGIGGRADLESKTWRRLMLQRVPFTGEARAAVAVTDPVDYGTIAEMAEAWAARTMFQESAYMDKATMAERWYAEEFAPVLEMIEEAGVRGKDERPADSYLRVACERYRLIREHAWNEDVMEMIRKQNKRSRKQPQVAARPEAPRPRVRPRRSSAS